MSDSDQGSEKIERLNIRANLSFINRPFDQPADCRLELSPCPLIQFRGPADHRIECRSDDLLCGNVIDKQQHPRPQRLDRRHRFCKLALRRRQLFNFAPVNRLDQRVRGGKCRYSVPVPTPARLAMSSKLASAPNFVNAFFASSRMLSRFLVASVRGLRPTIFSLDFAIKEFCNRRQSPVIYLFGDSLRFIRNATSRQ